MSDMFLLRSAVVQYLETFDHDDGEYVLAISFNMKDGKRTLFEPCVKPRCPQCQNPTGKLGALCRECLPF